MELIKRTLDLPPAPLHTLDAFLQKTDERYCFFDIETTGLSAKVSSLYLIGALWYDSKEKQFCTCQWFANDYISEKEILCSFTEFLSGFTTLVHYNGSGFDIPYIEKKCAQLELPSPFSTINSLDIYREIRPLKSFFDSSDLKLFTVEKLVGFQRKDILTGKDCIDTYSRFMQKKYFKDSTVELEKQKLLLHNSEDIIGTYEIAQLLSYCCPPAFLSMEDDEKSLRIRYTLSSPVPFPVMSEAFPFSTQFEEDTVILTISLFSGTLCHFFKNYKDYFYLPAEDTAIHKSVGTYVEKDFREPAKASNCYTKKEGVFLPVPQGLEPENQLLFRSDYKSRQNYLLWDEKGKHNSKVIADIFSVHIPMHLPPHR